MPGRQEIGVVALGEPEYGVFYSLCLVCNEEGGQADFSRFIGRVQKGRIDLIKTGLRAGGVMLQKLVRKIY